MTRHDCLCFWYLWNRFQVGETKRKWIFSLNSQLLTMKVDVIVNGYLLTYMIICLNTIKQYLFALVKSISIQFWNQPTHIYTHMLTHTFLITNAKTKPYYCIWERKMKSKIWDQQNSNNIFYDSERNGNGWNEFIQQWTHVKLVLLPLPSHHYHYLMHDLAEELKQFLPEGPHD